LIALDTNALVRMLIEDDEKQALAVRKLVESIEKKGQQIMILTEVLIETVWVFESVYHCTREEIYRFLEALMNTTVFIFSEPQVIGNAIRLYENGGDFADLVIVMQAMNHHATKLFSFDKKLQKSFPDYVIEKLSSTSF
jgi:predicted nucleic-acid-binding protein